MLEENEERRPGVVSYLTGLGRFREWRDCVRFQFRERFRSSSRKGVLFGALANAQPTKSSKTKKKKK